MYIFKTRLLKEQSKGAIKIESRKTEIHQFIILGRTVGLSFSNAQA